MSALTSGRVAQLASVGVETIRFYEREGLIAVPPRATFGYRHYPLDTVARLRFIKRAKDLGFSLKEIKELLALRVSPEVTCDEVRARAEAKIADIEDKIRNGDPHVGNLRADDEEGNGGHALQTRCRH